MESKLAVERRARRIGKTIRAVLLGRSLPAGLQVELKRAEDYCKCKKPSKKVMELIQYCVPLFRCEVAVDVGAVGLILRDMRCVIRSMMFNLSKVGKEEIVLFHGDAAAPIAREYQAIEYTLEAYQGMIWLEAKNLIAAKSGIVIFKNDVKLKFGDATWL